MSVITMYFNIHERHSKIWRCTHCLWSQEVCFSYQTRAYQFHFDFVWTHSNNMTSMWFTCLIRLVPWMKHSVRLKNITNSIWNKPLILIPLSPLSGPYDQSICNLYKHGSRAASINALETNGIDTNIQNNHGKIIQFHKKLEILRK